jgi:hypothetical protein
VRDLLTLTKMYLYIFVLSNQSSSTTRNVHAHYFITQNPSILPPLATLFPTSELPVIAVATRSMSSKHANILHHVKMPLHHLTTLEWHTTEKTNSIPTTYQTLPLTSSRQAELDALAAAASHLIDLNSVF